MAREGRIELRVTVKGGPEAQTQIEEILQVFNELKARAQAPVDLKLRFDAGAAEKAKKAREEWERLARAKMKIAEVYDPELERSARRFLGVQKSLSDMTKQQFSVALAGARKVKREEEELWRRRTMLLRAGMSEREFERKTGYRLMELSAQRFRYEVTRLDPKVRRLNEFLGQWWQRFGQVALGFTIAYRAMNAFEAGLRKVVGLIGEAISLSGDLAAMQGKMAAYLSLYGQAAGDFTETFRRAQSFVDAFARAAVKATTPMADLQEGFTELLKYGKVVPRSLVPAYTAFFDFIANIAATNRDYAKQIRSEIRGLMTGAHRAGNVLLFVIERKFDKAVAERIKSMIDAGKTLDDVVQEIAKHWLEFQELIVRHDPKKAFIVWQDAIRLTFVEAIRAARPKGGEEGGLFALPLKQAADRWKAIFEENRDQFALLFKNLALLEEKGIAFLEKTLVLVARLNNLFTRFHKEILAVAKAFGAMFMFLSARMFGRWLVGAVGKTLGMLNAVRKILITSFAVTQSWAGLITLVGKQWRRLLVLFSAESMAKIVGWIQAITRSWLVQLGVVVALFEAVRALIDWIKANKEQMTKEWKEFWKRELAPYGKYEEPEFPVPGIEDLSKRYKPYKKSYWEAFKERISKDVDKVKGVLKPVWDKLSSLWRLPAEAFEWPKAGKEEPGKQGPPMLEAVKESIGRISTSIEQLYTEAINKGKFLRADRLFPFVREEVALKLKEIGKELEDLRAKIKLAERAKGPAEEKEVLLRRLHLREVYLKEQRASLEAHLRELDAMRQRAIIPGLEALSQEFDRRVEDLRRKYEDQPRLFYEAVLQLQQRMVSLMPQIIEDPQVQRAVDSFRDKMAQVVDDAKRKLQELPDEVRSVLEQVQRSFEDILFDFMMGKFNTLKNFVRAVTEEIARMVARVLARATFREIGIGGKGGGFLGGLFKWLLGFERGGIIPAYQMGGVADAPVYMVGEGQRSEAIVPLPDNRHIPVKLENSPQVHITQVNVIDPETIGLALSGEVGRNIVLNHISANARAVRSMVLGGA